jgi:glucosylceramidase
MRTITSTVAVLAALCTASACGSIAFEGDPIDGSQGGTLGGSGGVTSSGGDPTATGGAGESGGASGSPGAGGSIPPTPGTGGTSAPSVGGDPGSGGAASGGGVGTGGTASGGAAGMGGAWPDCLYVTSSQSVHWAQEQCAEVSSSSADMTVNDASVAQTWDGFGAAFNELGWGYLTSREMQEQAMELLFGTDGCRFAWGRIPMGGSDYAASRYTADDTGTDVAPNSDQSNRPPADPSLDKFSIDRDAQKLIPYIKAAQAVKPDLRFWASPWTPPVWMKTGYKKDDGSGGTARKPSYFDGGSIKTDQQTLTAYAQYFVKFVQAYQVQGIDIEVVAPQNEPNYDLNYPSCLWDKATFATFIGKYLGPALASASLDTKIMLGTMSNGDSGKDLDVAAAVLADATARSFCSVVGVQWGMLDANKVSAMKAGLPVWATEHKCGNYPWNPAGSPRYVDTAPNDHAYAVESWGYIRDAINKVGVTSYNAWNMVLDKTGKGIDTARSWAQNALLVADAGKVATTDAYYVFRHLSQFVLPGASVVGTSGGDAVAFKNPDGSLVAVIFNSGAAKTAYTVSMGGRKVQLALPSSGWATVVVR